MSRLLIQSNGMLDSFKAGNYSLSGIKALCIRFHVEQEVLLENSALDEVFQLFVKLKSCLKRDIILESISIYWTNGVMDVSSSDVWQGILLQISELPTRPIALIDYRNFPTDFRPKNIRKLYFACESSIYLPLPWETIRDFLKNSCIIDFGLKTTIWFEYAHDTAPIWAHDLAQDTNVHRPIDFHSFISALRNHSQDLHSFVNQRESLYRHPELAAEIRLNAKIVSNFYAIAHLLYCNWKFPHRNQDSPFGKLPRDIFYLVLSLLHPTQWKENTQQFQELPDESYVGAVENLYYCAKDAESILAGLEKKHRTNLERPKKIRREMDDLRQQLQDLQAQLDNAPSMIEESQACVESAKQNYENALKRLRGHVVPP